MSKTPRYTASIEGQTFTRNSDRTYTHVVVARDTTVFDIATRSYVDAPADKPFHVLGFCGRLELAENIANSARAERRVLATDKPKKVTGRSVQRHYHATGPLVYRDVTILPLTDTRA